MAEPAENERRRNAARVAYGAVTGLLNGFGIASAAREASTWGIPIGLWVAAGYVSLGGFFFWAYRDMTRARGATISRVVGERDSARSALAESRQTDAERERVMSHLSQLHQAGAVMRDWHFESEEDWRDFSQRVHDWIAETAAWIEENLGLPAHTIFMDTSSLLPMDAAGLGKYRVLMFRLERHLANIIKLLERDAQ